jgi:glycosyltransferase involved in cell wall biosynthesis
MPVRPLIAAVTSKATIGLDSLTWALHHAAGAAAARPVGYRLRISAPRSSRRAQRDARDAVPVLIDGRHLSGLGATRGFGRYLRSLLAELARDPGVAVSVLVDRDAARCLPGGIRPVLVSRLRPGRFADLEHRVRLPLDIARHRSGVFHSAADERPPRFCASPWVHTLHDVPLSFSGAESSHELATWRQRRRRVRRADAVIAVSRYVAENAIAELKLDPARLHVIPSAADPIFSPTPAHAEETRGADPQRPYLLLVADYAPHKGFAEAFELIGALADRGWPHRLVQVGRVVPWLRREVDELLARAPRPERIQLAGPADDPALVRCYREADALVVTSRAEGFGLPVVEAMACATPVVAFDNSALPEVVGDGGLLAADGDVRALAEAVISVVGDPSRRRAASAAALRRSRAFSWTVCASAHVELFEHLVARASAGGIRDGHRALPEAL